MSQRKAVFLAVGLIVSVAALALAAREADKTFRPLRTAVVDRTAVFQGYDKRKDRENELKGESKVVEEKLQAIDKKLKELSAELPNFEAGPRKNEKLIEKYQIELDLKEVKDRELKRLAEKELKYLQEMTDEIAAEVEAYARSLDLDLVLEKNIVVGREGPRLPLVHFAKPEFEVTNEIIARLNTRHRSAPLPSGAKTGG